jgi:hypothetical protein
MNLAEKEIRGWAWNCGAIPLPLLYLVVYSEHESREKADEVPAIVRQIAIKKQNERDADLYKEVRQVLEQLAFDARLVIKLPRTLPALRREPDALRRIERDLYREFLPYGIAVAEVMPFSFKIGVFGLAKGATTTYTDDEKEHLLDAWRKAALRAEENFESYRDVFQRYLDGIIDGSALVNEASDVFYGRLPEARGLWNRVVDAAILQPNIWGLGIDLKKLGKIETRGAS